MNDEKRRRPSFRRGRRRGEFDDIASADLAVVATFGVFSRRKPPLNPPSVFLEQHQAVERSAKPSAPWPAGEDASVTRRSRPLGIGILNYRPCQHHISCIRGSVTAPAIAGRHRQCRRCRYGACLAERVSSGDGRARAGHERIFQLGSSNYELDAQANHAYIRRTAAPVENAPTAVHIRYCNRSPVPAHRNALASRHGKWRVAHVDRLSMLLMLRHITAPSVAQRQWPGRGEHDRSWITAITVTGGLQRAVECCANHAVGVYGHRRPDASTGTSSRPPIAMSMKLSGTRMPSSALHTRSHSPRPFR